MLTLFLDRPVIPLLFLTALANFVLGAVVLQRGRTSRTNQSFFSLSMAIGLWALSHAGSLLQTTDAGVLLFEKLIMTSASFIPSTFLWFSFQIVNPSYKPTNRFVLFHSIASAGFAGLSLSEMMVKTAAVRPSYVYWEIGWLYYGYSAFLIGCSNYGLYLILKGIKESEGRKRVQLSYVLLGLTISLGIGLCINIVMPIMGMVELNRFGPIGTLFLTIFFSTAVIRHQLLDIRVFVRRVWLLGGIYGVLAIISLPVGLYLHQQFMSTAPHSYGSILSAGIFLMGVITAGPILYAHFVRKSSFFHEHTMAGIAHELKSPLSTIESVLDQLLYDAQRAPGNDRQKGYLEMMERNAGRLRKFIDDLLLVMKTGAAPQLERRQIDLSVLCSSVVSSVQTDARVRNNQLRAVTPSSMLVFIDEAKIEQVISNLLSNAIKFTHDGQIELRLIDAASDVRVEIKDSGVGLRPDEIPYIFDRFYQGHAGQKNKGTGLGLAIAKLWVEAHGGKMWAESDGEGKGTTVAFTIPK